MKARSCLYEVEAGLTRIASLKKKQQSLQQDVDSFQALYQYLQGKSQDEVHALFEHIRHGASLEATLDFVKAEATPTSPERLTRTSSTTPSTDASVASTQQIHNDYPLLEDELLSAASFDITTQALWVSFMDESYVQRIDVKPRMESNATSAISVPCSHYSRVRKRRKLCTQSRHHLARRKTPVLTLLTRNWPMVNCLLCAQWLVGCCYKLLLRHVS